MAVLTFWCNKNEYYGEYFDEYFVGESVTNEYFGSMYTYATLFFFKRVIGLYPQSIHLLHQQEKSIH